MTDTFRALCAELLDLLSCFGSTFNIPIETSVVIRARALLAQPKPAELTDEELRELRRQHDWPVVDSLLFSVARAAIAADRARRPTHQPPADGEVAELVAWLREVDRHFNSPRPARAAELLQRFASSLANELET